MAQQIARSIEFQNRRCTGATSGGVEFDTSLHIGQRAGAAMDDPDMIVCVRPHANRLAEHPVIGHRFRPQRVHFKPRRLHSALRLCGRSLVEHRLCDRKAAEKRGKSAAQQQLPGHVHRALRPKRAEASHDTPRRATYPLTAYLPPTQRVRGKVSPARVSAHGATEGGLPRRKMPTRFSPKRPRCRAGLLQWFLRRVAVTHLPACATPNRGAGRF